MAGLIVPASTKQRRPIERGDDLLDIVGRVLDGDPTVGWRGDPTMDVYERGVEVGVAAFDARGERYWAAIVSRVDPDWRHTLLRKLRDGDWQDEHAFRRVVEAQARLDDENERKLAEARYELAERFASAMKRDNGRKDYY